MGSRAANACILRPARWACSSGHPFALMMCCNASTITRYCSPDGSGCAVLVHCGIKTIESVMRSDDDGCDEK